MSLARCLTCATALISATGAVSLSGPMPLAWRWFAPAAFVPTAHPVVSDGLVFVPIGKRLYALDAATGTQAWMFPPGEEPEGEFVASPAVAGDIVIVANTARFVYGLKKTDGSRVWSYIDTGSVRYILVDKDVAYLFTTDDRIVALDAATGNKAWTQDFEATNGLSAQPILADGHLVFYTSRGTVMGVNATTRRISWRTSPLSLNYDGGPVLFGNAVYVVAGQQIARLNPRTGQPIGRPLVAPERLAAGVAVTAKGGVAVTDSTKIYLFDPDLRAFRGQPIQLQGYLSGTPEAIGDNVAVKARNGSIYLLDAGRVGNPVLWEYTTLPIPGTMRRIGGGATGAGGGGLAGGGGGRAGGGGLAGGGGGGLAGGGGGMTGGGGTGQVTEAPADYLAVLGSLTFADGSLYALAEDGSVFCWSNKLGVDEVGPRIVLMSPPAGTTMNGQPDIDFLFRIEDASSGIMSRSIRVTMNGQDMKFAYEPGGGYLRVKIRTPGSADEGANPPLADGRKTFTVSVTDWLGNTSERSFSIVIDNTLPKTRERTVDDRRGGTGGGGGPGIGGG